MNKAQLLLELKADKRDASDAAQGVKRALAGLKDAFTDATRVGANAFLRSLAPAIRTVEPMVRSLRPAFLSFGRAAGAAVKVVAGGIRELGPEISRLIRGAGQFFRALAPAVAPFLGILLDIANAAMPHLINVARRVAATVRSWRAAMQGGAIQRVISVVVAHLSKWWRIAKAVGSTVLSIFTAGEPSIRKFVEWLAKGAEKLAKWAASREGQAAIKKFFEDTLPAVQKVVDTVAKILPEILKLGQQAATILGPLATFFGTTLKGVIDDVRQSIAWLKAPLVALGPILSAVWNAIKTGATAAWNWIKTAATTVANAVKTAWTGVKTFFTGLWNGVKTAATTAWNGVKTTVLAVWNALKSAATSVWNAIKTAVTAPVRAAVSVVKSVWNSAKAAVVAVWNVIRSAARSAWNGVKTAVSSAVRAAVNIVKSVWNSAKAALRSIWNAIRSAARSVWNGIKAAVSSAVKATVNVVKSVWNRGKQLLQATWNRIKEIAKGAWEKIKRYIVKPVTDALEKVKQIARDFVEAGKAIVRGIADGIAAGAKWVWDKIRWVIRKARALLPGSEPDDATSPLRNLADAGRATVANFAAGIRAGTGATIRAARGLARSAYDALRGRMADAHYWRRLNLGMLADLRGMRGERADQLRSYARGNLEAVAENLRALQAEIDQVAQFSIGQTRQLTAAVSNLAPALSHSVVRVPQVAAAAPRAAAAAAPAGGGDIHNHFSSPGAALPDPRYVAAQLTQELRNRGWTG